MTRKTTQQSTAQLGFDDFLTEADTMNRQMAFNKTTGHLPGTMDEALPFYRSLIEKHHAAMLAADLESAMALREEASILATKLNGGEPGILAGDDAPGNLLARLTRAEEGTIPLWGQTGRFIIDIGSMKVAIDMGGIFGIGAHFTPWMNFGAHAVEWDKTFISETGYRSFLGLQAGLVPGLTPDGFAREAISAYIRHELKGKLKRIKKYPLMPPASPEPEPAPGTEPENH